MREVTIKLDDIDVGQLLDGLHSRADAWRSTEAFFKAEETGRDWEGPVEECTGVDEARGIAERYERIIHEIEVQYTAQLDATA